MKIQEYGTDQAEGIILTSDIAIDDRILHRGYQLNGNDLVFLKSLGINYISGIRLESGDISADNALNTLAAKICGDNISYILPENGNCKLIALDSGVLLAGQERLDKFNRMNEQIILNSLPPYQSVKKGEVVAELTALTPIMEKDAINDMIIRLSGNESLLGVASRKPKDAALIYTHMLGEDNEDENRHFTAVVRKMVKNLNELAIDFAEEYHCNHNKEAIGDTLQSALRFHDLVFLLPAIPTVHAKDTLPAALNSLVDDTVCPRIPQNRASDLLIATKREHKIICLPHNYDSINSDLIDRYIKMAVTKESLNRADFSHPQTPILGKTELTAAEKSRLVTNRDAATRDARIAAVILAAGTSSRARCNKLMTEIDNAPLFMKTVQAALKSKASPVFIVTGHQAEKIEKELESTDINVLHNYEYATGVKTSIRLGLRSVPSYCDGAVLLPADMPNISAEHIDAMIDKFNLNQERQLLVSLDESGKHCNPVLWSNELYAEAELVPEDSDIRQVFIVHSDYLKTVQAASGVCLDVNFPCDIETITRKA